MIDIRSRWSSVVDRQTWAARRATFVTKVHATKVVWFPPDPAKQASNGAARTTRPVKKAARKTAKTTAGKTTKKAAASATKAGRSATKANGRGRKTSSPAKKTTSTA